MKLCLYQPEIPPNTGTLARSCAATRTPLHLIEPLGFEITEKRLRRAGLDYWPHVDWRTWPDWESFTEAHSRHRLVLTSARRGIRYDTFAYDAHDVLVFGPETRGLPPEVLDRHPHCVTVPIWGEVRSLNLACAATLVLYEAYRQLGFPIDP